MKIKEKGITMISLIVTIIVLLILAGVSIATLTGDNGLIKQAENAKEQTEIAAEKEIIELVLLEYAKNNEKIDAQKLKDNIKLFYGENKIEVEEIVENKFIIKFKKSGNNYILNNDEISERLKEEDISVIKVNCVNSNNEIIKKLEALSIFGNVEIPQTIITDEGLEYVREDNIVETTNTEINIKYILVCKDDKTLVFAQTDNDEYMLGTNQGQSIQGTGIKEEYKELEYILEIPEIYNNKPITRITGFSFSRTKIKKLVLSDNVSKIDQNAFMDCILLEKVEIGNNYSSMAQGATIFNRCIKLNKNSFSLSENNTAFKMVDGVLYSYNLDEIIVFPPGEEEFEMPKFVKILGTYSFYSSKLTSIYIPENIITWKQQVFKESNIQKINIQSNIFGGLCFWDTPLKEAIIGKNVTVLQTNSFIDHLDLKEIKYEGTKDEWNNITKENDWHNRCINLKTITCVDGTITL